MEVRRDEECALKVARALSYIDFSRLEKWYGELGFIKIFQGLRDDGTDLGWALLLGSIECALAGDRHLPGAIMDRILRDNRVGVQHLYELYPGMAPVRPHPKGFRVHGLEGLPPEALAPLGAALDGFGNGALAMDAMRDEMYRLHTPAMRDTLYYHAVLSAKTVDDPISAHMLWKAVRLLEGAGLPGATARSALDRLDGYQRQHLGAAIRRDPRRQSAALERFAAPAAPAGSPPAAPDPAASYRERAASYLKERGIPEHRDRLPRFAELSGYADGHLDQLLQPFILRSYCSEDEPAPACDLMLAVGPPQVDMPAMLGSIARCLGFSFMTASFGELGDGWAGELETELLRRLQRARQLGESGHGLPAMLVFSDGPADRRPERRAATPEEVVSALGCLLTGPRRKELMGTGGRSPVITVAAVRTPWSLDPHLRESLPLLRFELPDRSELERLLVRNVVGRFLLCDLDRISFPTLAGQAAGLSPAQVERVARRAQLAALDRRARELGTRLHSASERMRGRIRSTYLITQADLSRAIAEERKAQCAAGTPAIVGPEPGAPGKQTDLSGWGWGENHDESLSRPWTGENGGA
jgi:hypothetical protein